jgi:hypothetical protein
MGDEPTALPTAGLGGLGDEPSEAALQPEESRDLLQPEETGIPVKALGLSPPPTGQSVLGQINTALLPSLTTSIRMRRSASGSAASCCSRRWKSAPI